MSKHRDTGGGLKADSLGTFDSVVMAVAGCGPAYTVSATIPAVVAAVGVGSPAVLLYCAIPMVGIALAFRHLGRLDVNSGAAYSWVGRALHPVLGFLSGWALIVSTTVFMVSSTLPAGNATLSLLGRDPTGQVGLATAVGVGWFLVTALIVMLGARISAHAQTVITGAQLALLTTVVVLALARDGNAADFSLSWFGFSHFDTQHTFASGALIAVVCYWGWDVTGNLSEETRHNGRLAGLGGVLGVLVCAAIFVVFVIATNILIGADAVRRSPADFLPVLGEAVWPGWGGRLLVLAALLSTVAALETTFIQSSRTLFAMGRDRTVPAAFSRIHPRRQTPWVATVAVAGMALLLVAVSSSLGSGRKFVADAVNGMGLQVALYFALVGVSCVVVHRRRLFDSPAALLLMGVLPLCGALFMTWVVAVSVPAVGSGSLLIGLGALALGLIPMIVSKRRGSPYFTPIPLHPERVGALRERYSAPTAGPAHPVGGRRDDIFTDF
ncbi:APC family permease [Streptomyces fildesensis]|uniref:APC family permease n=1 Tax=Streptomyces fildesensis TaxID=375757 RepID=A0ABW8CI21_9ACTN